MDLILIIIWLSVLAWYYGSYFYLKIKQQYKEFDALGIKYFSIHENYGALLLLLTFNWSSVRILVLGYRMYQDQQIVPSFGFSRRGFLIRDPKLIKQITIKDFDVFVNHDRSFGTETDRLFGKILNQMVDDDWRAMRSTLSPMFTSSKMKMMFGILTDCVDDFIAHFEQRTKAGSAVIDCKETFSRFTVDGICSAVLGFKGDCVVNEDSELFRFATSMQKPSFKQNLKIILFAFARKIYILLRLQLTGQAVYDFFHNAIVKVMNDRESKGIFRPDMIQLLLQAKKGQLEAQDKQDEVNEAELSNFSANIEYDVKAKNKKLTNWTDEHFMAQGLVYFIAGFENIQILLSVTSFWLAKEKIVQQKLIDEVDQAVADLDGSPVTFEALYKMKYLDMVISESLRIWSPILDVTRECDRDYNLKLKDGHSIKLRKGDMMSIPIYAIHHDEKYFEEPEKFDPERFSDERKGQIVDGSYIPFGSGPRVCIGTRFALVEVKLLIFNILRKFTIEVCDKTPERLEAAKTIGNFNFANPIFVKLKPRF